MGEKNMKIVKRIAIIMFILTGLFVLLLFASSLNHQRQLSKEDKQLEPPGKMVEVDGHQMHIYNEGEGAETLIFMSGGGTSSPYLDFKSLYSLLSDKYRTVVVEKLGYGFSEVTDSVRDIDTILAQTRRALLEAGVAGPYILFAHSMSGIEALYWAQVYPEEVKAIVGIDMAIPAVYEDYDINMPLLYLGAIATDTGIHRWIPLASQSDEIKHGTLTEEEKELYRTILYRRSSTENMITEVENIKKNAEKIKSDEIPNIPLLLFSSNGQGTGWDKETWVGFQKDFVDMQGNAELIELDGSHYLHNIYYEEIAEEAELFIESLYDIPNK